jgi:hypothetical protein
LIQPQDAATFRLKARASKNRRLDEDRIEGSLERRRVTGNR